VNVIMKFGGTSVQDAEAMNRVIEQHQLRPVVDRSFSFGELRDALRHLESGAHFGKIVLRAEN